VCHIAVIEQDANSIRVQRLRVGTFPESVADYGWLSSALRDCRARTSRAFDASVWFKVEAPLRCCSATLAPLVRLWSESVRSFDDRHQPFWQFALHHVFIHQPQDSLWHLAVRCKQDERQVGNPLLDMAGYGFHVHAFMSGRFALAHSEQHALAASPTCSVVLVADIFRRMNLEDVSPSILRNPTRSEMELGTIHWLSKTAQIPHLPGNILEGALPE
jgi:hypothetical protein